MAKYPDEIYVPRVRENRSGVEYDPEKKSVWFKEDADDIENEVIALETHVVGRLATIENIDFKVLGDTLIYTVPTGCELIATGLVLKTKTFDSPIGDGQLILKRGSDAATLFAVTSLNMPEPDRFIILGLDFNGTNFSYIVSAGDTVVVEIAVVETGTALTFDVDLIGYLIPA